MSADSNEAGLIDLGHDFLRMACVLVPPIWFAISFQRSSSISWSYQHLEYQGLGLARALSPLNPPPPTAFTVSICLQFSPSPRPPKSSSVLLW